MAINNGNDYNNYDRPNIIIIIIIIFAYYSKTVMMCNLIISGTGPFSGKFLIQFTNL